ncbi:MAG: hypothetical protein LBG68_02475, partial [Coriobacteriales bacterium]|nr:hypothetical protein [Coriobacteriales bacterium]
MATPTEQTLLALGLQANTVAFLLELPLTAYSDSSTCRFEARYLPESVAVVVVNQAPAAAITPVNLAAALSQDCPKRDVYLWEDQPSGSLVSRIRAAGIRGVIDLQQLQQLLAMSDSEPVYADANPVTVETKIPNNPWRIDDTELEACDLDEPRDQPYTSTPAFQTGLDSRMDMMPNNPKAVPGGPFTSPSSPPNVQPPGAQPFSPT